MVAVLKYISEGMCYFKGVASQRYFVIPEELSPGLIIWNTTALGKRIEEALNINNE